MEKSKVVFRADGNQQIGLGHVIRSLALADMLKEYFDCIFVTRFLTDYIKQECTEVCREIIKLTEGENHFDDFLSYLSGDEIVVLDNYFFDTDYQRAIKAKGCKLVCIDDMHDKRYVADLVINQNPNVNKSNFDLAANSKLLIGFDYVLLRSPFLEKRDMKEIEYGTALIAVGGTDPLNITPQIISALCEDRKVKKINVIGNYESHLLLDPTIEVNFYKNLNSEQVRRLMSKAMFGVFPSSTVALEAISIGLDFLTGYFIDNQLSTYEGFVKSNVAVGTGDWRNFDVRLFKKKIAEFRLGGSGRLRKWLIDGKSKSRIRKNFLELVTKSDENFNKRSKEGRC